MKWTPCLTLAAVIGLTWMTWHQSQATAELAVAISNLEQKHMDPLVTTWTDAEGLTHTVTTTKKEGQSKDEWIADHAETVALMKAAFPPA